MTNKEAQIVIGNIPIKPEVLDGCYDITEYQEAKALAIKALEATEQVNTSHSGVQMFPKGAFESIYKEDKEIIQVSKGALKSRQGRFVIYDVDWLKKNFYTTEEKLYGQPKQPCEDCIRRESVRQLICKNNDKYGYSDRFHEFTEQCLQLPSATPQQKIGKWITQWNVAHQKEYYCCSECREEFSYDGETGISMNDYKYCPNCGAKMESEN